MFSFSCAKHCPEKNKGDLQRLTPPENALTIIAQIAATAYRPPNP